MEDTMEDTMDVGWLKELKGDMTRAELQSSLKFKNDDHFRKAYILPALQEGLIEMTIPDKPRSRKQRYRITEKGKRIISKKN
jgi:ATP-dependent DNA helicase RecG